jgi:hypothetical protein
MIIHKSFSKTDLIDLINNLGLKVVFSHQDNKKDLQNKLFKLLEEKFEIKENFYNIQNKDGLIQYLTNVNPKKTLTIKEKNNVMMLCKHIIQYCKNNFDLDYTKYDNVKELQDDMDFIKQFGDIPSVRRCCRLMNEDPKFIGYKFIPFISPQAQKELDDKKVIKTKSLAILKIRYSTPENPVIVSFD